MPATRDADDAWGAVLSSWRQRANLRLEDIARAARELGLDWSTFTVGHLEAGRARRRWKWIEIELLPLILTLAGVENVSRSALIEDLGRVDTGGGVTVDARVLQPLADGDTDRALEHLDTPSLRRRAAIVKAGVAQLSELQRSWGLTTRDVIRAERATRDDATVRAAKRLNLDVLEIALASQRLWGHSLTEQREAVVADERGDTVDAGVRTLRGHVTRRLVAELDAAIRSRRT